METEQAVRQHRCIQVPTTYRYIQVQTTCIYKNRYIQQVHTGTYNMCIQHTYIQVHTGTDKMETEQAITQHMQHRCSKVTAKHALAMRTPLKQEGSPHLVQTKD